MKSVCKCGHVGDGPFSDHEDVPGPGATGEGHGRCMVAGCQCESFTFVRWADWFKQYLDQVAPRSPATAPRTGQDQGGQPEG